MNVKHVFLLLICSVYAQQIIYHASCQRPLAYLPEVGLGRVKAVVDNTIDIAENAIRMMDSMTQNTGSGAQSAQTAYVMEAMLAARFGSSNWKKARAYYQTIVNLAQGSPRITLYCREDGLPTYNQPDFERKCVNRRLSPRTLQGYAIGDKAIVLCPEIFRWGGRNVWGLTLTQEARDKNWTVPGAVRPGQGMNAVVTASTVVLHELLHVTTWPILGLAPDGKADILTQTQSSIANQIQHQVTDISIRKDGETHSAYGVRMCRMLAQADLEAQAAPRTACSLWQRVFRKDLQIDGNVTPGSAVRNADSLTLAAIQLYVIKTDFITNRYPENFNPNGFTLPQRNPTCQLNVV